MNAVLRWAVIAVCGSTLAAPAIAEPDPESQAGETRDDSSVPIAQSNTIDYLFPDRKAEALGYEKGPIS